MNINTSNILEELSKNKQDNDRVNVNYYLYALYKSGEVIYIGQTRSLLSRIGSHANTKDFDEYSYVKCYDQDDLTMKEDAMIIALEPKYNLRIGKNYVGLVAFKNKINAFVDKESDDVISTDRLKDKLISYGIEIFYFKGDMYFHKNDTKKALSFLIDEIRSDI